MDPSSEAAWCPLAEQAQREVVAITSADALFQMGTLDYDFSSDLDQTFESHIELHIELHTRASQYAQFQPSSDALQSFASPSPWPTRAKSGISLACIPCCSRHTKCDATVPACSQYRASSRTCSYAESRRGRAKVGRVEAFSTDAEGASAIWDRKASPREKSAIEVW